MAVALMQAAAILSVRPGSITATEAMLLPLRRHRNPITKAHLVQSISLPRASIALAIPVLAAVDTES